MHADKLFLRMIDHEAAVEKAKADGLPVPEFEPGVPRGARAGAAVPKEELRQQWQEQLDKLPAGERAVEEAALRGDLQAKSEVAGKVQEIWESQKEEREKRHAEGASTVGDYVSALLGFGKGR